MKQSAREGNDKPRKNTRVDAPRDTSPRDTSPRDTSPRDTKQKNSTHAPGRRRSDEETFLSMESTLGKLPSGKRRLRFRLFLFHSPGRILLALRKLRRDFTFLLLLRFCRRFLLLLLLRTHVVFFFFFFFKRGADDDPMRSQRSLKNAFGARKTGLLLLRDGTTHARSQRAYHSLFFFLKMWWGFVEKKDVSDISKMRKSHGTLTHTLVKATS